MLKVANILYPSFSYEGKGMAAVIYFQGCRNRCDGCHNEKLQDFDGGVEYTPRNLVLAFEKLGTGWIDSVVLSGGEPLHQPHEDFIEFLRCLKIVLLQKQPVWLYTSYIFDDVPKDIRQCIDVIVDGPFIKAEAGKLRYRGSKNQRVWSKIADVYGGDSLWQLVVNPDTTLVL
jgi:anaerobic ribonucleoside-triphosphate reductase activating protein